MNELPPRYPNLSTFIKVTNWVRQGEMRRVFPDAELIKRIERLLPSPDDLSEAGSERPEKIDPAKYPDFESLKQNAEKIRRLRLVPVRKGSDRQDYNKHRGQYKRVIDDYLQNTDFAFELNLFPYDLPPDVDQYILWMRDREKPTETVAQYLAEIALALSIDPDDMIVFERPVNADSSLVRGTVPEFRHIHVWVKKRESRLNHPLDAMARIKPKVVELWKQAPCYIASLVESLHKKRILHNIKKPADITDSNVRPLSGGEASVCYWIEDQGGLVIKFGHNNIKAEAEWLRAARAQNVSVPKVKAYGRIPFSTSRFKSVEYIVLEGVTDEIGIRAKTFWQQRVGSEELGKIAREMGRQLAHIHTIEINSPYGVFGNSQKTEDSVGTWNEYVNSTLTRQSLEEMGFTCEEIDGLFFAISKVDIPQKKVFIHGDFGLHNVLITTNPPRIKIIDPDPKVADPYYDLACQYNRMEVKREMLKREPGNSSYKKRWEAEQVYFDSMIGAYSEATGIPLPKIADQITDPRLMVNQILRYFLSLRRYSTISISSLSPADRREEELEIEVKKQLFRAKVKQLLTMFGN